VAVFIQGLKAVQGYWPYRRFQIWRASPGAGQSSNQVFLTDMDKELFPCLGDFDNGGLASQQVSAGSEDLSIRSSFDMSDRDGFILARECTFSAGEYAPTATLGFYAGVLNCKGVQRDCFRRYDNRATTCGGRPASECGKLGQNCDRYYQHIADCRW
jgi:hypothetical protein